jgi:hypothetical protein
MSGSIRLAGLLAIACASCGDLEIGMLGADGGDAAAPPDLAVSDAAASDDAAPDLAADDMGPCPHYYINSGVCPERGLICRYFEAICYCDSNAGMWFCCTKNEIAMCPPSASPPPKTGDNCEEVYREPCQHDCVNGVATTCECMGCRWQCTTHSCAPDGGSDGG